MQQARVIKTQDEITLLNTACTMVDAAYEELYRAMRPGMRENECVALVNKVLYEHGLGVRRGRQRDLRRALHRRTRTSSPTARCGRATPPTSTSSTASSGYRTCYYRTFAVGERVARRWSTPTSAAATTSTPRSTLIRPGVTTGEVVEVWPKAEEFGFPDEEAAFALQFGHGVGLSIWEKPIFSRLVSLDHPEEIKEGMVFALETFWPATDGWSAARIEEQLVVTADGCEVITRFPAEDLVIAGKPYYTVGGTLPLEREVTSDRNTDLDAHNLEATPHTNGVHRGPLQPQS